jgi:drug/metabolite transporter (DMT)-like permease
MSHHVLGQTFALLAAVTWATALVYFKRSGETVPPIALNLFKNIVGILLTAATVGVFLIVAIFREPAQPVITYYHYGDICILMLSGIIGIAIADTIFFHALNLIGVGLVTVVDCLYSPMVILFGWLMLGEKLAWYHYVGAALILTGVYISSKHPPPAGRTRAEIAIGMLLAGSAVSMMAFGIVIAKPVLEEYDAVWAAFLRLAAGTVLLGLFTFVRRGGRKAWGVFKPSRVWRVSIPAAVLGTYLAMIFWVAGFKFTYASVAGILNQTSIIFALILASIILKERLTRRKMAAVVLAFGGALLITLWPVLYS